MAERIIRTGELSERSLVDAVFDERERGVKAAVVAVGSRRLELLARRALHPAGPLGELRPGIPNVVLDRELPEDGWELRAA